METSTFIPARRTVVKFTRVFGNEILLGTMVAILSVLTALGSYQGSMADSDQNKAEILGMTQLNDGNATYLEANQFIVYDYTMFDGWYTAADEEKSAYYEASYSEQLKNSILTSPDDPFNEDYYNAMYAASQESWDESDANFALASAKDERGDRLQLVVLLMALGVAFAAWAALIRHESNLRRVFGFFSIVMLVIGLVFYIPVAT
jgi:uncharacterized membrane protein YraQ (UPF0718 family)